ncbi:hypothetical protein ACM26V_04430 [Salipaludibacillus sp. HK11]|uniref:hypothetical protein n=1 Tax=Salipaludibacillus sp. HK11 TaxID=3394320 RepID=UPI0039FCAE55
MDYLKMHVILILNNLSKGLQNTKGEEEVTLSLYWAKFELKNNILYRFDTRIYMNPTSKPFDKDISIGAVVGKNLGSAKPYDNNFLFHTKTQFRK